MLNKIPDIPQFIPLSDRRGKVKAKKHAFNQFIFTQ